MSGRRVLGALGLSFLALLVGSCASEVEETSRNEEPVEATLLEVPHVTAGQVEPAVLEQIEVSRREIDTLVNDRSNEETNNTALAAAFGELGRVYQAYDLLDSAEPCFRNALLLAPSPRWSYLLAVLLETRGRLEEAESFFASTADSGRLPTPTIETAVRHRWASVLLELGRTVEARRQIERVLDINPDHAAAHVLLGKLLAQGGDYEGARSQYERALILQPTATATYFVLGQVLRDLGQLEAAREQLARAGRQEVRLEDPWVGELQELVSGAGAHLIAGSRAFLRGDLERAEREYRQAVAIDAESVAARLGLASVLLEQEDPKAGPKAVSHLETALDLDPESSAVRYQLGTALLRLGRLEDAIEVLDDTVKRAPAYTQAHVALASALSRVGQQDAALEHYQAASRLDPADLELVLAQAGPLLALDRLDELSRVVDEVLQREAQQPEARRLRGKLLALRGQVDAAVVAHEELLRDRSLPVDTRLRAAIELADWLESRGSEGAGGRLLAEQAREVSTAAPAGRLLLAAALGRRGLYSAAASVYETVTESHPAEVEAWVGLATALHLASRQPESSAASEALSAALLSALERGVAAHPTSPRLKGLLARTLASSPSLPLRDGERALELLEPDGGMSADNAETVAMAYAELGRFDDAVQWQERLLEQVRAAAPPKLVTQLEGNLERYRSRQRCCVAQQP